MAKLPSKISNKPFLLAKRRRLSWLTSIGLATCANLILITVAVRLMKATGIDR